jgi:signal transduction histidine kinase
MNNAPSDQLRVLRIAAWIWVCYLAILGLVDIFIYSGKPAASVVLYYTLNGILALLFMSLAHSKWLQRQTGAALIPLLIMVISGTPVVNHVLRLPQAPLSNMEGMVLRQLPVLFIALILVTWHYNLFIVLAFSVGISLLDLLLAFIFQRPTDPSLGTFSFIILIRAVCFLVAAVFINQLITRLRAQQESLKSANIKLAHHASTLETLTVSRERNRMSRELHDTVIHTLSGLSVQLETIKAYQEIQPQTAVKLLDQSLSATRSGLQETRRAIKALRASPLEDLGLVLAIQKTAQSAAERGNLALDISLPDPKSSFSPDVEQCVYRVMQEAVENVVQHANARQMKVKLAANGEELVLTIQDDGIGFNPHKNQPPGHFGLSGMQERAELAGGKLAIDSQVDSGTIIQLVIP